MCNSISGAYFVTAAGAVFSNRMYETLARTAPNIDLAEVLGTGAAEVSRIFHGTELVQVQHAYIVGIKDVFAFSLAGAAFTVLLSLIIPYKKLPTHDAPAAAEKTENTNENAAA